MTLKLFEDKVYFVPEPTFEEVIGYIENGLPLDHPIYSFPPSTYGIKLYYDSVLDKEHKKVVSSYANYPPDVLYSARYCDGLTAELSVYTSFRVDFQTDYWIKQYVHHHRIVYDYLLQLEQGDDDCKEEQFVDFEEVLVSGHHCGIWDSALKEAIFYVDCLSNIVGKQPPALMRQKSFALAKVLSEPLPRSWSNKNRDVHMQMKWLLVLQSLLLFLQNDDTLHYLTQPFYEDRQVLFQIHSISYSLSLFMTIR